MDAIHGNDAPGSSFNEGSVMEKKMVAVAAHRTQGHRDLESHLDRLKEAHSKLLEAIGQLYRLAAGPVPDRGLLVTVRWQVSQASLERRLLWGRIHDLLARQAVPELEQDLRELQGADMRLIRASADHVARWSVDAILDDWQGYRLACQTMRYRMVDAIAREKRLLYPMLSPD